ncbi:Spaf_1101 family AAA-like ATPase [Selenomonas montiformis]|uniref:Spaf_1101 family AAA-like ATPase n=1 Tax=Selenomonas montiformis TaxID=2652285 RepID=UPI003F8CAEA5
MVNIQDVYNTMKSSSFKYGDYHKCLFHIHTPASGEDYVTLEKYRENHGDNVGKGKNRISHDELMNLCVEKDLIPKEEFNLTTKVLFENNTDYYSSVDEMLKYLLIAWEMIVNSIELAVISDHNVIDGFKPLNRALWIICEKYKREMVRNGYKCPRLLLGTEISCADKNHVVGIFDDDKLQDVKMFLNDCIMSPQDGTYLTSVDVIRKIAEIGGIPYIAHIDTSNIFKENFLTDTYRDRLFNLPELNAIGFNYRSEEYDGKSRDGILERIKKYTDKEFSCFIDADSHAIDTIKDRCFYIKGQKCNFNMVKEAIIDNDIAISFDVPTKPECYISGIYGENQSGNAFLVEGKNSNKAFFIPMSTSLNCLIGGRGTGKSSILNIIEAVLGQTFLDENVLNAIFEYEKLYILITYEEVEYLILFMPRKKKYEEDKAYEDFARLIKDSYNPWYNNNFKENLKELKRTILKDCIQIFKIDNGKVITEHETSKNLVPKLYDRLYSVNELVKTASSKEIDDYIYNVMGMNPDIKTKRKTINSEKSLLTFLNNFAQNKDKRIKEVNAKIEEFNSSESAKNKIRITYSIEDIKEGIFNFEKIFNSCEVIRINRERYIRKTNLSVDGAIGFLEMLCQEKGAVEFVGMIANKQLPNEYAKLVRFTSEHTEDLINNGIEALTKEKCKEFLQWLNGYIWDNGQNIFINAFDNDYLRRIEEFSLQFNVMNKEGDRKKPVYRDVRKLSLGQKVVAMLSFVLGYSDFTKDYRPLVIDQPEDNLDNQYIFKNLVNDLRLIRGKRQIIIATHSATVVTNDKAEQVIVMESDGEHGWVADRGYVTEKHIKNHIINYMEGGKESFRHKINVYKDVLT